MKRPEELLRCVDQYKRIMSVENKNKHSSEHTEERACEARDNLWKVRKPKIERVNQKIELAKLKVQEVTPTYIQQLIGLYERENTSQKDKVYILAELKKYYSPIII